jgi:uncharacterized membrane protein
MDVVGGIVTGGIAIILIGFLIFLSGKMFVSLPAFNTSEAAEAPWAESMTLMTDNASTAFSILGILPLVIGASIAIAVLIAAFAMPR